MVVSAVEMGVHLGAVLPSRGILAHVPKIRFHERFPGYRLAGKESAGLEEGNLAPDMMNLELNA